MTTPFPPRETTSPETAKTPPAVKRLEQLTGFVIGLVLATLVWILIVAVQPTWLRLGSEPAEVIVVVAVLTAALGLVSLVALLHTRSR
jgi:hypothetical protein